MKTALLIATITGLLGLQLFTLRTLNETLKTLSQESDNHYGVERLILDAITGKVVLGKTEYYSLNGRGKKETQTSKVRGVSSNGENRLDHKDEN